MPLKRIALVFLLCVLLFGLVLLIAGSLRLFFSQAGGALRALLSALNG